MKDISIIVAIAENNAIGINNKLLCHIPGDLPRFKQITMNHTVIMGKNTFKSLAGGPLTDRRNIVISDDRKDNFKGCVMAYSIEDALDKCDNDKENFVIGGGTIYKQFLRYANKLYITKVNKSFNADVYFPELDYSEWEETGREDFTASEKNDFTYSYITYIRIK